MNSSTDADFAFYWTATAATNAAALACGNYGEVRKAYAAAFIRRNPKQALAILRSTVHRAEEAIAALEHFKARALDLMTDIEAAMPPEPQPETTTP